MSKSILNELQVTGSALKTALSRRGTNPAILLQLMQDFSVASDQAFASRSHSLVGNAAEQLKGCSRGFLQTLTRDSTPEVMLVALELFPMAKDYIEEALDELVLDEHAGHRDQLIEAMLSNLTRHETLLENTDGAIAAGKILERTIRLKADDGIDSLHGGAIAAFMHSLVESHPVAMTAINNAYFTFTRGNKTSEPAQALLKEWIMGNGDFLAESILQNQVTQWNRPVRIKQFRENFDLPRVAAALSVRTTEPSWEDLCEARLSHGIVADDTFKTGVHPTVASSQPISESLLTVLCAYSIAFEDVMPSLESMEGCSYAISALRAAADLLAGSEYAALPRLGDPQKVVDLMVSVGWKTNSMEPLAGCWLKDYAMNNYRYKASLFTQELGF